MSEVDQQAVRHTIVLVHGLWRLTLGDAARGRLVPSEVTP